MQHIDTDGNSPYIFDMDYDEFDELSFDLGMIVLKRYLKFFSIVLLATFVLPIARVDGSPVNVWDRFGVDGGLATVRLVITSRTVANFLFILKRF